MAQESKKHLKKLIIERKKKTGDSSIEREKKGGKIDTYKLKCYMAGFLLPRTM